MLGQTVHRPVAFRTTAALAAALWAGGALAETPEAPATPDPTEAPPAPAEAPPAPVEVAQAPPPVVPAPPDPAWAADEELIALSATVLDDRQPDGDRVAAAGALAAHGDPRGLAYLRAAARDAKPALTRAVLEAARTFPGPEAVAIAEVVVHDERQDREVRLDAIRALATLGEPGGERLWAFAGDPELPGWARVEAADVLASAWPEVYARLGAPRVVSDRLGSATLIAGNAMLGGAMLHSVGRWGQFDGGEAIGVVGGGAIGVGTAAIYARTQPVTRGQGIAYLSGTSWGLFAGAMGTEAAFGRDPYGMDTRELYRRRDQFGPLFVVAGTGAGAWAGAKAVQARPETWDVLETDLAGYLGSSLAVSVVDVALWRPPVDDSWGPNGYNPNSEYVTFHRQMSRIRPATAIVGAAGGLTAGVLLTDRWDLSPEDALFTGMVGAEASWIGLWWPDAVGIDDSNLKGTYRLPVHAALVGALVYAERHPVSARQSVSGAFGGAMGNLVGAGLPLLANADNDAVARVMLPIGLAGTVAGAAGATWLDTQSGDLGMLAVGMPLAAANASFIGESLQDRQLLTWSQPEGLIATTTGLTGAGLLLAGRYVEPRADHSLFVGTAAVWGGFYGALVPVALDADLRSADYGLTAVLTADAFALGGGLLMRKDVGLKPGHTVLPQLGGLTGATLGSLFVSLATTEGQAVAAGAVGGAVVGTTGGALLGARARRAGVSFTPPQLGPRLRPPGRWTPSLTPMVSPDGGMGFQAGLVGTGW